MEKMKNNENKFKTTSLDEMIDKHVGKVGTEKRDAFENELRLELLGHAIKMARKEKKLTQEELGELVGVQKAQISKIESGKRDLSFSTIIRAFRAMGISAKLDMGSLGVYAF